MTHIAGRSGWALAVSAGLFLWLRTVVDAQYATRNPRGDSAIVASEIATTERVIVTGSYIPMAESESALPVTIKTGEALQKQGATTPAEGLRQLPSFVGHTLTENDASGSGDGTANVTLRGLGPNNTLVLINGRRSANYRDINAIPLDPLQRVEVLKDGASAIYGSDAVAGVVNFVLLNSPGEKPYEGAEISLLYGNTTDKDARLFQTSIRGGLATDRVAIAVAAEYYDREALFARDREISANADVRSLGGINSGSPTFPGRVSFRTDPAVPASARTFVLIDPTEANPSGPRDYRRYGGGESSDPLNTRAFSATIPAATKYHYYAAGSYNVFGDALQLYADLLYTRRKHYPHLAPAPFSFGTRAANASPYNPFLNPVPDLPAGEPGAAASLADNQLTSVSYRSFEGGPRAGVDDHEFWRCAAGLRGSFSLRDNNVFSFVGYDAGAVYEFADRRFRVSGDARRSLLEAEVAAGNFNPFRGIDAPLAGTATTYTNGVPTGTHFYDNTAAFARAAYVSNSLFNDSKFYLADGRVFGNVAPGLYQGGIAFNAGFEYRQETRSANPDVVAEAEDTLAFGTFSASKFRQRVYSFFGELELPLIISSQNITGAHSISVGLAYRYEKFDNEDLFGSGSTSFDNGGSPRLTIRYQPVRDLTLRASWGKSFLSPQPGQLFEPAFDSAPFLFDPLTGQTLQLRDHVQAGGNPALQPEKTDTYSAGLIFTPRFLPGFTLTVDLYQVYTRNLILESDDVAQLILTANGNSGGVAFANLVTREEGTNVPTQVIALNSNAGKRLVNGMDITATYAIPTDNWGTFTLSAGYNYFFTWKAEPIVGSGTTNFLGDFNDGTVPLAPGAIPYHKGFFTADWSWKGFVFTNTVNYISSFNDDSAFLLAANITGGTDTAPQYDIYRRVSDYITLDMQLSYEFTKPIEEASSARDFSKGAEGKSVTASAGGERNRSVFERLLWGTQVTIGVNNAFDRNPPTVLGAFSDSYDTSLYTVRNRFWYVGIRKKF